MTPALQAVDQHRALADEVTEQYRAARDTYESALEHLLAFEDDGSTNALFDLKKRFDAAREAQEQVESASKVKAYIEDVVLDYLAVYWAEQGLR